MIQNVTYVPAARDSTSLRRSTKTYNVGNASGRISRFRQLHALVRRRCLLGSYSTVKAARQVIGKTGNGTFYKGTCLMQKAFRPLACSMLHAARLVCFVLAC